jgi:hypothetical protein
MGLDYYVDQDNLIRHLKVTEVLDVCDYHRELDNWAIETKDLKNKLKKIGRISILPNEYSWEVDGSKNQFAIRFDKYPYFDSEIFQCIECGCTFFFHLELGINGPQKRYRNVKSEWIDIDAIKPAKQVIVDYKPFEYIIYKNPDLSYGVSISKRLGIGIDIYYELTTDEVVSYLRVGISGLRNRLDDMDKNYQNYKVTSWR